MAEEDRYQDAWDWIIREAEIWEAITRLDTWGFSAEEQAATYRQAARDFQRQVIQCCDLAAAINEADIGSYIRRWYGQEEARPNGPSPSKVHTDECAVFADTYDPATIRWGDWGYACLGGELEAGKAYVYYLPSWDARDRGVGLRSRLRNWTNALYRGYRELRHQRQRQHPGQ